METQNNQLELSKLGFGMKVIETLSLTRDRVDLLDVGDRFLLVVDMRWRNTDEESPIAIFTENRFFIIDDPQNRIHGDDDLKFVWKKVEKEIEVAKIGKFETTKVMLDDSDDERLGVTIFEIDLEGEDRLVHYEHFLTGETEEEII